MKAPECARGFLILLSMMMLNVVRLDEISIRRLETYVGMHIHRWPASPTWY